MWNWVRKIPTLGYGKCGSAARDCSISPPRDWMDRAFEKHDNDLQEAKTKKQRDTADKRLGKILKEGNSKKLKFYGKIYRILAMFIFKA